MKFGMKKKAFLLVLLSLVGFLLIYQTGWPRSRSFSKTLAKISKEDREVLEAFFFELQFSGGAYVLFGDKPMSICSFALPNYSQRMPLTNIIELSACLHVQNIKINKGWDVWKKYSHLFSSSQFFIVENRCDDYVTVAIINKRNFLKIVEENIDVFRQLLGVEMTPDIVLSRCLASSDLMREVFQNHHVLLGIVLGYGRHNAQLFSRKIQIEEAKEVSLEEKILPAHGFSNLEEEYQSIQALLSPLEPEDLWEWSYPILPLPGFVADFTHPETHRLRKQYQKQHKKIIKKYKNRDFLTVTLEAFCA